MQCNVSTSQVFIDFLLRYLLSHSIQVHFLNSSDGRKQSLFYVCCNNRSLTKGNDFHQHEVSSCTYHFTKYYQNEVFFQPLGFVLESLKINNFQ